MPFALLFAQATGIAQRPQFIGSVLVITSVVPIQIYLNEVFAPRVVRYQRGIDIKHALEVSVCALALSIWAAYRLDLPFISSLIVSVFSQGYIWFSYVSSRKILKYQSDATIGGRYSFIIGSIIPLTFLLLVFVYWLLQSFGLKSGEFLYSLILLPNAFQYTYIRWLGISQVPAKESGDQVKDSWKQLWPGFFPIAVLMAIVSQHWKVELAQSAQGFAALSIYMIVPFSSAWLILSKSRYLTQKDLAKKILLFWAAPVFVGLTLFLNVDSFVWVFPLALITQVLTFKFITDVRIKASVN